MLWVLYKSTSIGFRQHSVGLAKCMCNIDTLLFINIQVFAQSNVVYCKEDMHSPWILALCFCPLASSFRLLTLRPTSPVLSEAYVSGC